MERHRILSSDSDKHPAFFRFVDTVFGNGRSETWTMWQDRGGWTVDYEVFALVQEGAIVGTIGRSRMHLVIEGENRVGYQLGAVAVLEHFRGRGIARQLMECVIDSLGAAEQPIILFANSGVHDFYPRFGFQRLPQQRSVEATVLHPSGEQSPHWAVSDFTDRARLADLCARARPTRARLTARDYGWLALWNLTCEPVTLAWLPEHDAAIAFTVEDDRLIVHDVLATAPFDLLRVTPTLITKPVTSVELLIDPMTHSTSDDSSSPLFARGHATAVNGPVQFTPLAQT